MDKRVFWSILVLAIVYVGTFYPNQLLRMGKRTIKTEHTVGHKICLVSKEMKYRIEKSL